MIRLLVDDKSTGYKDLYLKIDVVPEFLQIADSYYLYDFLGIRGEDSSKTIIDLAIEYLNFFMKELDGLGSGKTFVPFDLSDQCIGGLMLSPAAKGLLSVSYVFTTEIQGHSITMASLKEILKQKTPGFQLVQKWIISKEAIRYEIEQCYNKIKSQ